MEYIATFDIGTTAVKGVLVDLDGRAAAARSLEIPTLADGRFREQRPQDWWDAFRAISLDFCQEAPPEKILGVAMSGQMQDLIPLDGDLDPVCPAILYADGRAEDQAEALEAAVGPERFLALTGSRCDGSLPLPKLMWLRERRPELYARTRHILISSKDYVAARLTGVCAGDVTACSTAGAMDIREKRWSPALLGAAGVPEELFPRLLFPHERAGAVLPGTDCGYLPGTPVYAGVGDAGATTLACGAVRPGQYSVNLGTSGWVAAVSQDVLDLEAGVFNLAAPVPGYYMNVVPFLNAGNVHRWISGVLTAPEKRAAGETDYAAMTALLAGSAPGSHGVMFLPYLVGERFPVLDPDVRGSWVGLTPETSPADLARACLEGVAFSLRQGLELLGTAPEELAFIGGGGREAVWQQILADVLGRPVSVSRNMDLLPARAVASIALLGQGRIGSYEAFTGSLRREAGRVSRTPSPEARRLYDGLYEKFRRLYPALRAVSAL